MTNLHWHRSINFGDMLSPYFLSKIKRCEINYVEATDPEHKYVLTGSILSAPGLTNATVFGAGFINYSDIFTGSNVEIKGVRGFHTLNKLKDVSDDVIIGDPGFMLPIFYNPHPDKKYHIGIIPHISDIDAMWCNVPGTVIIDLRQQDYETIEQAVERVVYQICQCDAVISGSLHGMVAAKAYGVQILGRMASKNIIGDGFKFDDFESAGNPDPVKMFEAFKKI